METRTLNLIRRAMLFLSVLLIIIGVNSPAAGYPNIRFVCIGLFIIFIIIPLILLRKSIKESKTKKS
jgi:hypothetical protein